MPKNAKGAIFINYRREDSNWNALALYQELQKYFSKDQIFKDFNAIQPGDDFVESIGTALQRCDVLLVLIGKQWLDIKDADGKRRLDDPEDFVRLEISKALARNIKVIPVILDEVKMPHPDHLPENMRGLARRQLVEIDPTRFEDDVRNLAGVIKKILRDCGYEESDGTKDQSGNTGGKSSDKTSFEQGQSNTGYQNTGHQNTGYQQTSYQQSNQGSGVFTQPPKPDNNLVWGILTTILCGCGLPLGVVSIVNACRVDGFYREGKYADAKKAADDAKKFAIWAAVVGGITAIIYCIILAMEGGGGY